MVTIADLAKELGVTKATVRNHISKLELWGSVQRDGGVLEIPNATASAVAASVSRTAAAGTGRPQGPSSAGEPESPHRRERDEADLVAAWRARFEDERERADAAEVRAAEDRSIMAEEHKALVRAMGEVAKLSASEASASARADLAEAEVSRVRDELERARAETAILRASVEAVRAAGPWRRLLGLAGLLPPPAGSVV